jgi:type II secretory pathway pseudopilin PulG
MKLKIKKKLHPKQKAGMIFVAITGIIAALVFPSMGKNNFESKKADLKRLYEVQFNNCTIIEFVENDSPGGVAYDQFKTDCNNHLYPIIIEYISVDYNLWFKEGNKIRKKKNSYDFVIESDKGQIKMTAVNLEGRDSGHKFIIIMILGFTLLVNLVQFVIPYRLFEQMEQGVPLKDLEITNIQSSKYDY